MRFGWLAIGLLLPGMAFAEGSAELVNTSGNSQGLFSDTVMFVDIVDPTTESIFWSGTGSLTITTSTGGAVGTVTSGSSFAMSGRPSGIYRLSVAAKQPSWDIEVRKAALEQKGRLFSYAWHLDGGGTGSTAIDGVGFGFTSAYAFTGSFYALVKAGGPGKDAVVELNFNGMAGWWYHLFVNGAGISTYEGQSVNYSDFMLGADPTLADLTADAVTPQYPLYLSPPAKATYITIDPQITVFEFDGQGDLACNAVAPNGSAEFTIESNVEGVWQVVCDTDNNGVFDPSGNDVILKGEVSPTDSLHIVWDGTNNDGVGLPRGTYNCQATVTVGELHWLAADIETMYPGFRLYQVQLGGARRPLQMFWNDLRVNGDRTLANAQTTLTGSGAVGIGSGAYGTPAIAASVQNLAGNARAWGSFQTDNTINQSTGDRALLDTYAYVKASTPLSLQLDVIPAVYDGDNDGAPDLKERCFFGTDPLDPDSDDDTISDGDETNGGTLAVNTDGDSLIDALDTDSDNDGVLDIDEAGDTLLSTVPVDSNTDGLGDWRDPDVDDDGVLDGTDNCRFTPNPDQADDDHDGVGNACEGDSDGDLVIDEDDNCPLVPNPGQEDVDNDGIGDACDPDNDNDGIDDVNDNCPTIANPGQEDADIDGIGDACDDDSDNDGISDMDEGTDDPDGDGFPNYLDDDSDGDGILDRDEAGDTDLNTLPIDTDSDGTPDYLDLDSDNDTILDRREGGESVKATPPIDTDRDGIPDFRDFDSDDDTIADRDEAGDADLDTQPVDSDNDTIPNYLDLDSDNDTISDKDEDGDNNLGTAPVDTDLDGTPDFLDLDTDGDGISDAAEAGDTSLETYPVDSNGNDIPDWREPAGGVVIDAELYDVSGGGCTTGTGGTIWLALFGFFGLRRRR